MTDSLKAKATSGILWNGLEKFSGKIVQLIVGIILARILLPEDFGLIAMLSIFIAISQTFVDSGMGSGLIQKQKRTDVDFSTVFVFNLVVSFCLYAILFVTAPLIADFYNEPRLIDVTRVLSLNILINALAIVQRSRLQIDVDFKNLAKVNVSGTVISGAIAILTANYGYGVWALVIQQLLYTIVTVTILWSLKSWKPSITFSKKSFKELFGFGSKLMIASIYAKAFQNIYDITIGKYYSADELGYYNRAKALSDTSSSTIASILQQVTYPILSSIQDDRSRLISIYKRMIRMAAFLIVPSMTLLALLADPLIKVLLTEKWAASVVLLQWLAFAKITYPISVINMNILNAIGRSDLFLKVDLSKAPVILIILLITIPISVKAMVIGYLISSVIAFFINAYIPGRLFGYGAMDQLKDMLPYFFATIGMAISVTAVLYLFDNYYMQIGTGGGVAIISYLLFSSLLKVNELSEFRELVFQSRKK
ncbi:lipopolysaccharide biosynthesis protein [Rhodohalobacter sulfatireducens]|uniref:Lipopolysaccharide biosynthesis protein n=1 Tax=Rhodohalobacter sulfatireducens TaxID=2911366 RepID=A0ABS9KIW3_9BACT|nr:lipopolysaccharide biosynthesis protein [Rhodohalobacter sulfatireducens]MCG2590788.1 lipopolysaccharide biosynthesis protein [Rhodohalobacter sulfatireducens]